MADQREVKNRAMHESASRVCGLYAVTPDQADTAALCDSVSQALEGGASLLQYRNKTASQELRGVQAHALAALCAQYHVEFIVNDDLELALRIEGAGLHVGAEDGDDLSAIRRALGPDRMLGVSCYAGLDRARTAVAAGADYVAFGSVFASPTKPLALRAPLELIEEARGLGVPIVGIGGITLENLPLLIAAGANAAAVISELFGAADVRERARMLAQSFDRIQETSPLPPTRQ